nr:50S ribosomal protein L29 [Methanothermus fervidus]
MSVKELEKKLEELRAEYSKEESKAAASGAPDNPGRMRELRRTIARILTIINEKKT